MNETGKPSARSGQSSETAAEDDRRRCPECGRPVGPTRTNLIPDPAEHPTVPVWPVVGMVFGKKRSAILELARQGRLPVRVLRVGGSYRVATAELLRVLGQDQ
jgi:hypothetical protein